MKLLLNTRNQRTVPYSDALAKLPHMKEVDEPAVAPEPVAPPVEPKKKSGKEKSAVAPEPVAPEPFEKAAPPAEV